MDHAISSDGERCSVRQARPTAVVEHLEVVSVPVPTGVVLRADGRALPERERHVAEIAHTAAGAG